MSSWTVAGLGSAVPGFRNARWSLPGAPPCRPTHVFLGLALGLLVFGPSPLLAAAPLRPVSAVVHAHSTWSSGDLTLDELITRARAVGIEAIFLTENHLHRFEYGVPPLRNLLRYRVEYPSLLSRGPAAFLEAVRVANARQKEVLLIPGAEVIPHYYWTGNLLQGTLTMHNAQKNLLAFGLNRPEDYRELPVVGNAGAARWNRESLWLLSPAALAVPGLWLMRARRRRVVRLRHFRVAVEGRRAGYGILCLGVGAALLANNFPFRTAPVSPYDPTAGLRPYQAAIDFALSRGGLVAWSLPEARDHQVVRVAGLRATIETIPYPADLLRTDRFTAFGGVYEDTTTFTAPGGGWDQLLAEYLGGRRAAPAWAIGEAAYHREGQAGKRLGDVQTIFLVERKEPAALLEALRKGRMYALRRTAEVGLVLDQFQAIPPDQPPAEAGDRVTLRGAEGFEVRAAIDSTGSRGVPIHALLVRAGTVVHSLRGETPLRLHWREPVAPQASVSYRIQVVGPPGHQILSNPIFVQGPAEGTR